MAWALFSYLCLLLGTLADELNVISPFHVFALTAATEDGAAVSLSYMSWVTKSLPIDDWYVAFWVQIKAGTPSSARLLQATTASSKLFYVTWPSTSVPTFTYDGNSHPVTGTVVPPHRQENKWIHMVMGSNAGTSFGVASLREGFNNQFTVSWSATIWITSDLIVQGPVSASPFAVSSK